MPYDLCNPLLLRELCYLSLYENLLRYYMYFAILYYTILYYQREIIVIVVIVGTRNLYNFQNCTSNIYS